MNIFKLFDFFADYKYLKEKFDYNEVLKLSVALIWENDGDNSDTR